MLRLHWYILFLLTINMINAQEEKRPFDYMDVFDIQYAANPQLSPDGKQIIYQRNSFDIMQDKSRGVTWIMDINGENHRKLTNLQTQESQAIWSPEGDKIAFVGGTDEGNEIYLYWPESNVQARISQLRNSPSSLTWSPDGTMLAFSMFVEGKPPTLATLPKAPKGANWAKPARITTRLKHEADGRGYLKDGYNHIFIVNVNGGAIRQITQGNYNFQGGMSWTKDSKKIIFSANLTPDWEYKFNDSNIHSIDISTGEMVQLTANIGPSTDPQVSPDGKKIGYLSYDDKIRTYQVTNLMVMNIDGSQKENWTDKIDRSISSFQWRSTSKGVFISYDDFGNTKIARLSNVGYFKLIGKDMGGTTVGRPYPSGHFHVSGKDVLVYTHTIPERPAEIAVLQKEKLSIISSLNKGLLEKVAMGKVQEIRYNSTKDKREIQAWVVLPPNYDSSKRYPLLVENHGGPILNYGDRFTAELQLYASKGYVVFYPNPRGSTSYGEKFGDLLYNNYPGDDYQDVMDGVDYMIKSGYTSEDQLFVTGGSAGGTMTAWMVGKNNRFEAAVVHKPVMNWISKTLVADNYYGYANYRYRGQPWENFKDYWKFSPISLVGNIETPTMVMVGMEDLRTPPSEAKQLYHALKIRKKETMLVEIPGASHGIAKKPSNLIAKVAYTIAWCDKFRKK